ncbi:hypothetical protein [Streptomyces sp. NPDC001401]|uniref:hypothetical protein n=1 Tax=Streptomyces sp. NPDC001401 TaxID=3364570 RepID=UPI003691BBC5
MSAVIGVGLPVLAAKPFNYTREGARRSRGGRVEEDSVRLFVPVRRAQGGDHCH